MIRSNEQFPALPAPAADLATPGAFPISPPAELPGFAASPGAIANRLGAALDPAAAGADVIIEYRVEVGHIVVSVCGASPTDAIRLARSRLCLELPRLWDVIRTMDESRFHVVELHK